MTTQRALFPSFSGFFFAHAARWLVLLLAASLALHAMAQDADPPGRVAYLNDRQGTLSMSPAGDDSWYDVIPNRPLTQGDRLWVDRNGRAEIYVGPNALRMDGQTDLAFDELGDQSLRVAVQQGRLQLRVREDVTDQRIELGTGNLRMVVRAPGDYRVLVDPAADSTQIMVAQGSVTVYGANGQVQELGSRQQAVYVGRDLTPGGAPQALSDDFERWLAARNQAEEQSQSARYVSPEMPGYQQLDAYGQWQTEPGYGAVWYPRQVAPGWAPYSDGYWIVVAPWGLTWVDRAPWGFAPFHYGRWTRIGARWCWVPGQRHVRPVYSPALVAFVGGAPGANFTVRGGQPAVGWFPLAPGDRWRPAYRASDRYIERANRVVIAPRDVPAYANRAIPNAVTAVPVDRFGRGPITRRDHVRPPDPRVLSQAQVLPRPPVQLPAAGATSAGSAAAAMGFAGRRSSAVPPEAIQARQQQEWRQRFEQQGQQQQQQQQQREQRDQARSAQRQQELQERAARDQQDLQRRGMQEQQQLRNQQQAQQQQEQARRQAEQQQENAQRQARQQEQQSRRQAEQQEQQSRRQLEQQAQQQEQARRQAEQQQAHAQRQAQQQQQQQEQMRRQAEQQQENAQRQARQQEQQARRQAEQQEQAQQSRRQMEQQAQQQEQARRQAEQQQANAQRQAQQQQEQMRRQAEQQQQAQQMQQQQQAQRAAQMQAQQQQEQMRRQMEQQQAHAQRQAQQQQQQQQQQEQMRRQAEQAARQQQQQQQMQQQQMQQQAEQQARQREQQQRQQQQQQQAQQQRQRGGSPQSNDPQQQQRP